MMRSVAALTAGLILIGTAAADSGGGPSGVEIRDRASPQIAAMHAAMVARATALGVPPARIGGPQAAGSRGFQYPLQMTRTAAGFAAEAISNHVDHDDSANLRDFACGTRTYDGHQGTDIYLSPYGWDAMDRDEMRVVAALPGVIVDTHDGEFDRQCAWLNPAPAANYVVVRHDNGLVAYYWHLKAGSVTTKKPGSRVAVGERLGLVGSSGISTGPHLHFEVRDAGGTVVDPYAGSCGTAPSTRWLHQAAPVDPAVLRVATHAAAPPGMSSHCDDPEPGYANRFDRGSTVFAAVYLRDQTPEAKVELQVVRPDGSVASAWTTGAPDSGFWSSSYWYTSYGLPADAPLGLWRVRAKLGGRSFEHAFTVGPDRPALKDTTVAATVANPVRTVAAGKPATFVVTLRNTGPRRATGCRLSLARPILADVTFREIDPRTGKAKGALNKAFVITARSTKQAVLTITPREGFAADRAEFGVQAKCVNAPASAFARGKTMLTLTGG